jgi:hypothetical protein
MTAGAATLFPSPKPRNEDGSPGDGLVIAALGVWRPAVGHKGRDGAVEAYRML